LKSGIVLFSKHQMVKYLQTSYCIFVLNYISITNNCCGSYVTSDKYLLFFSCCSFFLPCGLLVSHSYSLSDNIFWLHGSQDSIFLWTLNYILVLFYILELLVVCPYNTGINSIFHYLQYWYFQYCPYNTGMTIFTSIVYNTCNTSIEVVFFTLCGKESCALS